MLPRRNDLGDRGHCQLLYNSGDRRIEFGACQARCRFLIVLSGLVHLAGRFRCLVFIIRDELRHSEGRLQIEALEQMKRIAASPEVYLDMSIGEGDIQFLNNRTILHGRTAYDDSPDIPRRRHMMRLWLEVPSWPPLPCSRTTPPFQQGSRRNWQ